MLAQAERSGNTCLPSGELFTATAELLGHAPDKLALDQLAERGDVALEGDWIYRAATAELEAELAQRVAQLIDGSPSERLQARPSQAAPASPTELTEEQQSALDAALQRRISVVTGGPGTGKTASIRSIAGAATARGARVMLVAPTGRAAVRMTESSGVRARTVHSALGWIPGEGPTHDEQDPLVCELLIVDETSMANLELLVTLLRAVGEQTHVVLVGDADQLAPGRGRQAVRRARRVRTGPTTRLTHIFRQAAGSMIVQGAHAIRRGQPPSSRPPRG